MRLGLERSRKVFDGGTRCVERHGSESSTLSILQRFGPDRSLKEVIRQVNHKRLLRKGRGMERFDRFRKRAMKRLAFADEQLAVDRLPGECMTEGETIL